MAGRIQTQLQEVKAPMAKKSISAYLGSELVKKQIENVVGNKGSQRFVTSIVSAVTANPALQECSNASILSGALLGEALNLSPSPQLGHYYLVPFNDKYKGKVATFQLGYKGMLQLAIRSGCYKKLNVLPIKEGELISFDALEEEIEVQLIEDERERESAKTIGYYAMFEYTNGFRKAIYWSKEKMESHALKYSKGFAAHKGYTFWEKDFDAMACKTMIRQLISKWGIMSIDMMSAFNADNNVIDQEAVQKVDDNTPYDFEADMVVEEVKESDAETADPAVSK